MGFFSKLILSVYHKAGIVVIRHNKGSGEQSRDRKEEPSSWEVSQTSPSDSPPTFAVDSQVAIHRMQPKHSRTKRELVIFPSKSAPSANKATLLMALPFFYGLHSKLRVILLPASFSTPTPSHHVNTPFSASLIRLFFPCHAPVSLDTALNSFPCFLHLLHNNLTHLPRST